MLFRLASKPKVFHDEFREIKDHPKLPGVPLHALTQSDFLLMLRPQKSVASRVLNGASNVRGTFGKNRKEGSDPIHSLLSS